MNVTIVKLGGSLAHSPQREAWLAALVSWGGPLILVPGGGPFADGVRKAQDALGFDDAAAHRMALLAMEQFAIALAAHSDAFVLAGSLAEMDSVLEEGKIPIWLPSHMALSALDLPASWDVTSDSLAAWLAGTYGARRLLLIKSCDSTAPVSACDLAADQIVDPLFPRFAAQSQAEVWLAGPASLPSASEILRGGGMPGAGVSLS
ncbi:dihydroneopterin aldolase [Methylocapsa polymorpha]|uniref:Dihydroneopterin aldolase n=1 Tax=Methylocapsa polymorpha TaxID=3080828 RepID=A0ABZ0HNQ2_9HYPH|nr:dihydroneopterin aldolase [Methylocapsa sp. RX1]